MKLIIRANGSVVNISDFESLYVEKTNDLIMPYDLCVEIRSNRYILSTYKDEKSAQEELVKIVRTICTPEDIVYSVEKEE